MGIWGRPWCGYRSPTTPPSFLAGSQYYTTEETRGSKEPRLGLVRSHGSNIVWVGEGFLCNVTENRWHGLWLLKSQVTGCEKSDSKRKPIGHLKAGSGCSRVALEAAWDQLLLGFPSPTDGSTTLTMLLLSGMFTCILVLFWDAFILLTMATIFLPKSFKPYFVLL